MRPRLDPAVRYVACPDGVYLYGDRGARTLRGARAFEWLSRLEPYLNGELELDMLTAALPADQRATVEGMVTVLHEHGYLTDAQDDLRHRLSEADQQTYAREIAFLACAIDSPEHRFQRHREGRVTVFGAPGTESVVREVVAAGVRSGWADVRVLAGEWDLVELARAAEAARRDEQQRVVIETPAAPAAADFHYTDVVLQISSALDDLAAFVPSCPQGVSLGQMLVGTDEAWISEVGDSVDIAAASCWKRLRANRKGTETRRRNRWVTGPVPAVLAAHMVLSAFRHRTGLATLPTPGASGPRLTRVDLRTLDMTAHRVAPIHVVAERGSQSPQGRGGNKIASTLDDLLTKGAGLVDENTGVISVLDEGNLPQFPLSLCRAVVSDPAAVVPAGTPLPEVLGWGPDQRVARIGALLRALGMYAWLASDATARTTGLDLLTGETLTLSTEVASEATNQPAVGVAAGLTQADAISWGLRQQCEALLIERRARWTAPAVDAHRVPLDEAGGRLLHQLDVAGCRTSVLDLGDILRIPAYAVRTDRGDEVVSCAANGADAVRDGLARTLLAWQGYPAGCTAPVASEEPGVLVQALDRAGFTPVAMILDSDVTLVHTVRVVLDAA
ncbi:hypothetical protein ACIBCN_28215 [Nocardia sp. NPDC051052]|uniref:hypothetical protein n=1 Tax=Nocardia sp. NPDC051052 TaxID=3364322 RepID=UPI0037B05B58